MRDLAIAYGNNRQAKTWVNKTIKYADLKERLKVTIRTTESAEEYAKMTKDADLYGFVVKLQTTLEEMLGLTEGFMPLPVQPSS